mmetsp:Transcript_39430/g.35178  ORF Transcript_39430/g.35178 Transcript_39430/m.35178 type:complete len:117 (+) Transcript_39430:320-670(+)
MKNLEIKKKLDAYKEKDRLAQEDEKHKGLIGLIARSNFATHVTAALDLTQEHETLVLKSMTWNDEIYEEASKMEKGSTDKIIRVHKNFNFELVMTLAFLFDDKARVKLLENHEISH